MGSAQCREFARETCWLILAGAREAAASAAAGTWPRERRARSHNPSASSAALVGRNVRAPNCHSRTRANGSLANSFTFIFFKFVPSYKNDLSSGRVAC